MQIVISSVVKNEIPHAVIEACSEIRSRGMGIYHLDIGNEPLQVRCLERVLWISQENDFEDHIL